MLYLGIVRICYNPHKSSILSDELHLAVFFGVVSQVVSSVVLQQRRVCGKELLGAMMRMPNWKLRGLVTPHNNLPHRTGAHGTVVFSSEDVITCPNCPKRGVERIDE